MFLRHRLISALKKLRAAWQIDDAMIISAATIDYEGQRYQVQAHARYVSIKRLESGRTQRFSTDDKAEHYELARQVFDGFEWDLTTAMRLISVYEVIYRCVYP